MYFRIVAKEFTNTTTFFRRSAAFKIDYYVNNIIPNYLNLGVTIQITD